MLTLEPDPNWAKILDLVPIVYSRAVDPDLDPHSFPLLNPDLDPICGSPGPRRGRLEGKLKNARKNGRICNFIIKYIL